MRFTILHLLTLVLFVALIGGWWVDRQQLSAEIRELNARDMVTVIDLVDSPSFAISESKLKSLPNWKSARKSPPVTAADARRIGEKILKDINSLKRSAAYESIWLKDMRLVPIVDHRSREQPNGDWCYVLDFVGLSALPEKLKSSLSEMGTTQLSLKDRILAKMKQAKKREVVVDESIDSDK